METRKYFGCWNNREDLVNDFCTKEIPSDDEILFAAYWTPPYEGFASVIYRQNGTLYEVEGSHCSCNGLEGQWGHGGEITPEYLTKKTCSEYREWDEETQDGFNSLVALLLQTKQEDFPPTNTGRLIDL